MLCDISRYRLARIEINPLPEATVVLDQHLQGARVAQSGEERDQDIAVSHRCGTGNPVADVGLAVMQDAILLKYFGIVLPKAAGRLEATALRDSQVDDEGALFHLLD